MALSTGKPKTTDHLYETAYLRVLHNKVSDIISAESKDLCNIEIKLSYRVNFTGPKEKWFNVENYVKFLTDHLRSIIRGVTKQYPVEKFYEDNIAIIRDAILGEQGTGIDADSKATIKMPRPGKLFEENGMHVYDVEVLDVLIGDAEISSLLVNNQTDIVKNTLYIAKEQRSFETTNTVEDLHRKTADSKNKTKVKNLELQKDIQDQEDLNERAKQDNQKIIRNERLNLVKATEALYDEETTRELERTKRGEVQKLNFEKERQAMTIQAIEKEAEVFVQKAASVSDKMITALQEFGDKNLLSRASEAMGPMALLGGNSVVDVVNKMFSGTKLEGLLAKKVNPEE
jgi:major vault protein